MADCCYLTNNFYISDDLGCIVSVSVSTSTETSRVGDCIIVGPTIGTVSLSGYATDSYHVGCPGRAGVQIPWVRKYDCDNDVVHFIFSGEGKSQVAGDVGNLATVNTKVCTQTSISASSSAGPALYTHMEQDEGYGLDYIGNPISFNTTNDSDLIFDANKVGAPYEDCRLQSFSLECTPGQIPVATYSYVFAATCVT
jgi:hypothetical protein